MLIFFLLLKDFPDPGDTDLLQGIDFIKKNDYKRMHFEKIASYDNEYSLLFVASIYYLLGLNSINEENKGKTYNLFKKAVTEWKNCVAEYRVGYMYLNGDGLSQSTEEAIKWLTLAADKG